MSTEYFQGEERWLTGITAPLISLPQRRFVINVLNARLSRFVLLVSAMAVGLMLSANIDGRSKVLEVVDVIAVVDQRPELLNELRFEEWFDIVDRPLEAPEGDVIL